jgi:hypothetical protein
MRKTTHKHRIIPGHRGGEYVDGNVVELTITQHAMWHFAEWQLNQNVEDKIAWQGLAGMITKEEAIRLVQSATMIKVLKSLPKSHWSELGKKNAVKLQEWWASQPKSRRVERSRIAGLAGRGITGRGRNGGLAQTFEQLSEKGKIGSQVTNSTLWEDPNHPELGAHHFQRLAKLQRQHGYPSGKSHRRKVS